MIGSHNNDNQRQLLQEGTGIRIFGNRGYLSNQIIHL